MRLFLCGLLAATAMHHGVDFGAVTGTLLTLGTLLAIVQDLDTFTRAKAERRGSIGAEAKR